MTAGGGGSGRFVGREREMDSVLGAIRGAAAGRGGTLLLAGSSGIGASRLIDEAVAASALAGDHGQLPPTILRGDALPAWRGAPYGPVRVALTGLLADREPAEILRLLGPGADLLLPLLPAIAARLPDAPAGPASRERLAERTQEAVRAVLGRLAADRPVVLVLEDLHALDAATRALLAFLARTLGDRPILLLGSYQPDALGRGHPLRATIEAIDGGPQPARRLELAPLERAALRSLIEAHEDEPPSAPLLLLVAERSAGSPLVAEEVLAARRELSGASLSSPLEQLVVARAVRRSRECRRVLRALAVADGPVTPAELAAIVAAFDEGQERPAPRTMGARRRGHDGLDPDLSAGVDEAVAAGFAARLGSEGHRAGRRSDVRPVRIRHELIAAALAADLLPGSRRRMHAAVARALERHPAEAARHWHRVHEAGSELLAATAAAASAEAAGAAVDALGHLERAIEVAGAPAAAGTIGPDEELGLLHRAAEAASGAGETGRAVAFVELALARLPDARDRSARAALTERLGGYLAAGGDRPAAFAAYERALELLPATPSVDRARVLATMAQVRMLDGSFSDATTLAEDAAADAAAAALEAGAEARAWLGHATCTLGVVDGWLGRTDRAVARLEEALGVAVALGRLEDAFRARANLATMLDLDGRRAEAVEVARQGIRAAEEVGLEVVHGNLLRGNAVDFLVSLGQWDEARQMAERALDWAPSGIPFVNAAVGLAIIETETSAGDAAARLLGQLFLELETVPDLQFAVQVYQAAASLALWRGDLGDAVRAIELAWSRVRDSEDWPNAARTAAALLAVADARVVAARERRDLTDLARARSWGDGVLRHATNMVEAAGAPPETAIRREVDADLATARALAARLHGNDDAASWAEVAGRWRSVGRPYEAARALHREAEAHLAAGAQGGTRREGRDDARAPLAQAASIAAGLGAIPLLRALADVAERARVTVPAEAAAALAAGGTAKPAAGDEVAAPIPSGSRPVREPGVDRATAASFGLSPREQGVLAEIVAGRTNREIGERLFISEKTVGVHVGNILAKLGVGGRVEAATFALRLGLVDDRLQRSTKPGPGGPGFTGRRRGGAA